MKRFLSFIIVLVLSLSLFAFAGCTKDSDDANGGKVVVNGLTIESGVVVSYEPTSASDVELEIPEKAGGVYVSEIAKEVFKGCKALKTVKIPAGMRKINSNAFRDCSNLEGVYIEDLAGWCGIEFVGNFSNPINNNKCGNLYINNVLAEELIIPSHVNRIESRTFYMCTSIRKITIPKSVNFIGQHAFYGVTTNLERFRFEDPNNWGYSSDPNSTKGSTLFQALKVEYRVPGDTGWNSAIAAYIHFGQYYWIKSDS